MPPTALSQIKLVRVVNGSTPEPEPVVASSLLSNKPLLLLVVRRPG